MFEKSISGNEAGENSKDDKKEGIFAKIEKYKKKLAAGSAVVAGSAVFGATGAEAGGYKNRIVIDGKGQVMNDKDIRRPEVIDVINSAPKNGNIEVDLSGQLATDNGKVIGNKNKDPKDMVFETQEQMDKAYQDDMMKKSGIR